MRVIGLAAVAAPSNAGRDHPGRRSAPRIKIDVRGHPGDRWVVDPVNLGADQRFCAISTGFIDRWRRSSNAGVRR